MTHTLNLASQENVTLSYYSIVIVISRFLECPQKASPILLLSFYIILSQIILHGIPLHSTSQSVCLHVHPSALQHSPRLDIPLKTSHPLAR